MSDIYKYNIRCVTEDAIKNWFLSEGDPSPTTCPTNTSHEVDLSSVVVTQIGGPQQVIQVLGQDSLTLSPRAVLFTATKNTTTTQDKVLDMDLVLRGGVLFSKDAAMGDSVTVSILDPSASVIITEYVKEWFVMPNIPNELEDVSISSVMPAGLIIRIAYTNTSNADIPVILNLITYELNNNS